MSPSGHFSCTGPCATFLVIGCNSVSNYDFLTNLCQLTSNNLFFKRRLEKYLEHDLQIETMRAIEFGMTGIGIVNLKGIKQRAHSK